MKYNKISLYGSSFVTILAFVCYFVFNCEKIYCKYVIDISLALIGSGVFLIVTSVIGYFVEKRRAYYNIVRLYSDMGIEERLLSQWDSNGKHSYMYTKSHLKDISLAELDKMSAFVIQMQDYVQGCFIPSRKLKNTLNKDIRCHMSKVLDLKDYLIGNHVQEENIMEKLQNIIESEREIFALISEKLKFKTHKDFETNYNSTFTEL